jgi:hypothetical protein
MLEKRKQQENSVSRGHFSFLTWKCISGELQVISTAILACKKRPTKLLRKQRK